MSPTVRPIRQVVRGGVQASPGIDGATERAFVMPSPLGHKSEQVIMSNVV